MTIGHEPFLSPSALIYQRNLMNKTLSQLLYTCIVSETIEQERFIVNADTSRPVKVEDYGVMQRLVICQYEQM